MIVTGSEPASRWISWQRPEALAQATSRVVGAMPGTAR